MTRFPDTSRATEFAYTGGMHKDEAKQRAAAASAKARASRSLMKFKARLDSLGAQLLEDEWLGARTKHHVRCAEGHDCYPMPNNVITGFGICKVCAGISPAESFAKFKARLAELGATLMRDEWLGRHVPHAVVCAAGHSCTPQPGNVLNGLGVCVECSNTLKSAAAWNAFYIVKGPAGVKFGVTSGDYRQRLNVHRRDGYPDVVAVWIDLPNGMAKATEDVVRARLKADDWRPVRGLEYFPIGALAAVQRIASAALD